jgi:hypothetical protein
VPILGWLLLRGRCRDCGTAISAGYPAVEAACGLIATTIAAAELAGAGTPLLTAHRPGIDRLLAGDWRIALAWAVHTVIPVAMLAWNLTARVAVGTAGDPARGLRAVTDRNGGLFVAAVILIVTAVPAIGCPSTVTPVRVSGASPWLKTAMTSDARPVSLRTMVAFSMRREPTISWVPLPEFIEFCIVVLAPKPCQQPASRGAATTTVATRARRRTMRWRTALTRLSVAGTAHGTRGGAPDARDILMDLERGLTI